MTYGSYAATYRDAEILSRPPEWIVPLVFEHVLKHLSRAKVQIETRDYEGKACSLEKASELIYELLGSLDREAGGEIAERLAAIYAFLAREIAAVGRSLDVSYLQRLIAIVTDLHEAWVGAAEQVAPRGRAALAGA